MCDLMDCTVAAARAEIALVHGIVTPPANRPGERNAFAGRARRSVAPSRTLRRICALTANPAAI
jgi:hypothetical protein